MSLKTYQINTNKFFLKPCYIYGDNVDNLIKEIKMFITEYNCKELILDLSDFNLIYATQLGILVATNHFINFIDGNINIIVDNEQIKDSIDKLNLNNAKITVHKEDLNLYEIA